MIPAFKLALIDRSIKQDSTIYISPHRDRAFLNSFVEFVCKTSAANTTKMICMIVSERIAKYLTVIASTESNSSFEFHIRISPCSFRVAFYESTGDSQQ